MTRALRAALCLSLAVGCVNAPPSTPRPSKPDPLVGGWEATEWPKGTTPPCPLLLEIFEDGSAQVNWLNDNGDEKLCSAARLRALRDTSVDPPVLRLGGQLSACRYRIEGELLRLACEDHEQPPADLTHALTLRRIPLYERQGLAALVGSWMPEQFWNSGGGTTLVEVTTDGRFRSISKDKEESLRLSQVTDTTFDFSLDLLVTHCRYRVTEQRWTFRCLPEKEGYPPTIWEDGDSAQTVVLVRPPKPASP